MKISAIQQAVSNSSALRRFRNRSQQALCAPRALWMLQALRAIRQRSSLPKVFFPLAGCLLITACQPMYSLELKGEWRLQNIHSTGNAALSTEETLRWRDYSANFSDRNIRFAGRDCINPDISSDWQQLGVVANRIGMDTDLFTLNSETPVQLLYIECENSAQFAFGSEIIRIDEDRLIMAHEGVMFEFRPR